MHICVYELDQNPYEKQSKPLQMIKWAELETAVPHFFHPKILKVETFHFIFKNTLSACALQHSPPCIHILPRAHLIVKFNGLLLQVT